MIPYGDVISRSPGLFLKNITRFYEDAAHFPEILHVSPINFATCSYFGIIIANSVEKMNTHITPLNFNFMKKILALALMIGSFSAFAQKQSATNGTVKIFGSSPATDVEATSHKLIGAIDPSSREFAFKIDMTTLDFPNDEMESHYNEKYMQTDQAENRYATFKGKILGKEDFTKDGTYKVVAQGILKCHNVEKNYNIIVTLRVKDGKITASAEFYIALKDHKIDVPSLVFAKIGENIKINVDMAFAPTPAKN